MIRFTSSDRKKNRLLRHLRQLNGSKTLEIKLFREDSRTSTPSPRDFDNMAGQRESKDITVKEAGEISCYLRATRLYLEMKKDLRVSL